MDTNKILSAPLIDLIFDGRNKDYGAYQLRKTNSVRTRTALSVTISVVALVLSVVTMANGSKKNNNRDIMGPEVILADLKDEKPPEKLPEPEKQPEPEEPIETKKFTPPEIVDDKDYDEPPPAQDDLKDALVGLENIKGKIDSGYVDEPKEPVDKKGIITQKETEDGDEIRTIVEVPARFTGNWTKFLLKNLDPETPVKNNAGPGRYSVVIQFVVDREGMVSDIKPLTNHGYGMEEEAIRVLRKAPQWEPAIQNGHKVKAYHRQTITFQVEEEQ